MSKEKTDSSTGGLVRQVERLALAAALFAVPIAFATGLSRYEVLKRGLLALLGGIVLFTWTIDLCRGRRARTFAGGWTAGLLWLFVIVSTVSLWWTPSIRVALWGLLTWVVLSGVFASVASRTNRSGWVGVPLVLAAGLTAVSVLLTRFGLGFPPDIPTGMAFDAGAHGTFDHALLAGAFLAVTGPVALYLAALGRGRSAWLWMGVAVLVELAVGVTTSVLVVIALTALLLGAVLGVRHVMGKPFSLALFVGAALSIVALVVGRFAIGPAPVEPEAERLPGMSRTIHELHEIEGWENVVTGTVEWRFEWDRAQSVWSEARLLGHGAGSWPYLAGQGVNPEHPYYVGARREYHTHQTPPGFVAGILVEQGVVGLCLWMAFLVAVVLVAVRGLRRPAEDQATGAGFLFASVLAALAVGVLMPAVYHSGEGVAFFAVLGLAAGLDGAEPGRGLLASRVAPATTGRFARFERWTLVGIPLLAILAATVWNEGRVLAVDYQRQRGELFLMARQSEAAIDALEAAVGIDPDDYRSHYLLGLARYYTPSDDARRQAARENLARAAALWPNDARVRVQAIRTDLHQAGLGVDARLDAAASARNELRELLQLDPRNPDLHRQLADTLRVLGNHDEAATVLLDLVSVSQDRDLLGRTHFEIGRIFEDQLSDPERALSQYQQAQTYVPVGSPLARNLAERITFVQEWLERGTRPPEDEHQH